MTCQAVQYPVDPTVHPRFIDIYEPIAGHKAVEYWWNPEGFWEPWETGFCAYSTAAEAYSAAKYWAECEELPYVQRKEYE